LPAVFFPPWLLEHVVSLGPLILKLPRRSLARRDAVRTLVGHLDVRPSLRAEVEAMFAFKDDELAFARAVADRTQLWVFRVNQRAFAGDFVVIDVSAPSAEHRPAIALDLKRGARVREGRPGIQMGRTDRALAVLVARGLLAPSCVPMHVVGDARQLLGSMDNLLARARVGAGPGGRER
jgi:hypothetical protein